ncbi:TetR/AcrR family transcriptional regulator [Vitiosangium sp. GDMCC 1.1324]|uniref:TetR/AcrR family transcriptional regulator n=1 Tax=Vitiosangium sp. (strain GDMCC 1.1324) TaxID=2138576 RepID=UPI000D373F81|nr:TetR/AcrR family transcriptional regulator [Vitiosangium sp. GDMCC 1.1324]PTL84368.1 TetR family transcriptional regulator [Vitiosangium sp. GDMCC 1.1324]
MVEKSKEPESSVRERILEAAITCIERDGFEATGIRSIAKEAGVNSAAINYYFRSKDNLLALAFESTLEQAFSQVLADMDARLGQGLRPKAALHQVLEVYFENATRYPRIAYAHFREALVNQNYDIPAVRKLNEFLDELSRRIAPDVPHLEEPRRRIALSQVWSAVYMFALLPDLYARFSPADFSQSEERRRFVAQLLAGLFGGA